MKFIHTADWHLGRILFGVHLVDDQKYILNKIETIIKQNVPDFIIIAGDVYDRAVPPPSAVKLLDQFLKNCIQKLNTPVIIIAGNHDSPERLGFASSLLEDQGIYIKSSVFDDYSVTTFSDQNGDVDIFAVPYAEPVVIRERMNDETLTDHNQAMKAILDEIKNNKKNKNRTILVSHAFVAGGNETESERPLSAGGSSSVDIKTYDGFNYVALGHLHRAQQAGKDSIRYSGSILPYSFEEGKKEKSLTLVTMGKDGKIETELIPLTPRRKFRTIKGIMDDILSGTTEVSDDYIQVILMDKGPVLDAMGKLRAVFPNILHIERPYLTYDGDNKIMNKDHRKLGENDLFSLFFKEVTGEDVETPAMDKFNEILDNFKKNKREA